MAEKSAAGNIALMGNPNAGKSSIFNALTGLRQHVGNWPGKTVEKREGICVNGDLVLNIVDLPGTYSLTADSPEEQVARDYLLSGEPDLVIDVVDATNLERNLYLTVQILEMGIPVVIALNMTDQLQLHGTVIDKGMLSTALGGTPILSTTANRGAGVGELLNLASAFIRKTKYIPEPVS